MTSSLDDDEDAFPSTPAAKRGVLQANKTPLRTPTSRPRAAATPIRKPSGNAVKTPNTAPTRMKTGNPKKNEPTLLGDFLLGRPSPARQQQRRKSLDAVKQELKEANVAALKVPGGVKERVKQWQKANSAAVVIEDHNAVPKKAERTGPKKTPAAEVVEDSSIDEEGGPRERLRGAKRPGRRKSRDDDDSSDAHSRNTDATPKRRVISDEHWMKNRSAKKSPVNNQKGGSQKIPKDFLTKTAVREPLGQRVQDWIALSGPPPAQKSGRGKPIKPESKTSRQQPNDDGIRVKSQPSSSDGLAKDSGISIGPLDDSPNQSLVGDGIRVKPIRKDGSKRRPKESRDTDRDEVKTPTRRPEKHLRPIPESTPKSRTSSRGSRKLDENEDQISTMTPSPPEKVRPKARKSDTPSELSEIPFGNSAFSVLELPLGAEANSMPSKRPPPKRNPSFGVPKVLKKVYNAVQNNSEPARGGPNQPASIESWLHGTSDPFFDRPSPPQSTVPSRNTSNKENGNGNAETEPNAEGSITRGRIAGSRGSLEKIDTENLPQKEVPSPKETKKSQDPFPNVDRPSPISPSGLRRSPATRNTSSPKVAKKSLLKDAIFDAFKGESAIASKSKEPNPFAEITGFREIEVNRMPSYSREQAHGQEENSTKGNPLPAEKADSEEPGPLRPRPLPLFPRQMGPPPTSGGHRLSTIASVETFSSSSAADTASEISQTTVTQETIFSRTTISSISRKSNNKPSKPGVKTRLTKHSDLLSVLSLPDAAQPGRSTSIRSARSVRTTRSRLETATMQDLMREVAEDEAKYMRELKTLVDGVIPVLLTCVLSKSQSAVAAGLFNPHSSSGTGDVTKPIVDMGVSLERLKNLHRRIPIDDADALIDWANQAHKTYRAYLVAWRTGFEDVVVNLAPASQSASAENDKPATDEMRRNSHGDIIGANGERVDVAYLLKRPLIRVKYLTKAIIGICKLEPSTDKTNTSNEWRELEVFTRKRAKEEDARHVDQVANMTDPTRSRDPRTLRLVEDVKIDQTRQVYAKDSFFFDICHSNGQRIECRVEVLIRDKASNPADGDILICEVNSSRRFLLFPPISKGSISARKGDNKNQLVVMIRGVHESSEWAEEWRETFILEAEVEGAAEDWLVMLGSVPVPSPVNRMAVGLEPALSELSITTAGHKDTQPATAEDDVPIGERRRREAEEIVPKPNRSMSPYSKAPSPLIEESVISDLVIDITSLDITDLNDAMSKAGSLSAKQIRAVKRYHSKPKSSPAFVPEMSGALEPYSGEENSIEYAKNGDKSHLTNGLPYFPKLQPQSVSANSEKASYNIPLKESMRPEPESLKKQETIFEPRDDGAPPPPPHRILTPVGSKSSLVLDSPTPKAKVRRSSSPLKHEYQPSLESGTSSPDSETSEFDTGSDSDTFPDDFSDEDEDEDEDELEAVEMPSAVPGVHSCNKRLSPSGSLYSVPNSSLAPSNSASQGPDLQAPQQRSPGFSKRNIAYISGWSDKEGKWIDLHPGHCSIVITPGLIQAFKMTAAHSSSNHNQATGKEERQENPDTAPLLAQIVTPNVPLRQSNAVDIEIRVHPISTTILDLKRFHLIRYRTSTPQNCAALYQALHLARLQNPQYLKLEEERRISGFGQNNSSVYERVTRKSWIFGRKKSYRASTRAPSEVSGSEQSGNTRASAFSVLRGMGRGGDFNIARSTVHSDARGSVRPSSNYTSSPSDYSGPSPPRTPTSPSLMGSTYSSGILANRGNENMKIRLYEHHGGSKWVDLGAACLTVTIPAAGMRQASSLYHGVERRIIVTRKATSSSFALSTLATFTGRVMPNDDSNYIFLDIILGAACFSKVGRTGVCANVWEDITGPNGEVGMVGAVGGVAGRTRKWLFQTGCQADANWVFSLCAVGRNY